MRFCASIGFFFLFKSVLACSVPPAGMYEDYHSLVQNTPGIVLAVVVSTGEEKGSFLPVVTFEIARVLKGRVAEPIRLPGYVIEDPSIPADDYDSHHDPKFWAFTHGNSSTPGDCQMYGIFHLGETYLLFLREQGHIMGFENVRSSEDLWLKVVEQIVAEQ